MAKFLTIPKTGEGIYREKMSRFLAFALPVSSVDDARECIALYANEYHDARHVCWAYMIGASRTEFQSNDNGEPSGTAGRPILGQINSFQLTNIVIIVVRYFGGIKLGTSGLIAAYKEAAREAIIGANIIELHEQTQIEVTFPYISMNSVMKIIKDSGSDIMEQIFDNSCYMKLSIRSDHADILQKKLSDIDGTTIHNP